MHDTCCEQEYLKARRVRVQVLLSPQPLPSHFSSLITLFSTTRLTCQAGELHKSLERIAPTIPATGCALVRALPLARNAG